MPIEYYHKSLCGFTGGFYLGVQSQISGHHYTELLRPSLCFLFVQKQLWKGYVCVLLVDAEFLDTGRPVAHVVLCFVLSPCLYLIGTDMIWKPPNN